MYIFSLSFFSPHILHADISLLMVRESWGGGQAVDGQTNRHSVYLGDDILPASIYSVAVLKGEAFGDNLCFLWALLFLLCVLGTRM